MLTVECSYCGSEIKRKQSYVKRQKHFFCSRKCQSLFRSKKVTLPCAKCGDPVERQLSEVRKSASGNVFCSRSCANSYNNSSSRLGKNHPNFSNGNWCYRGMALREYGSECQNNDCELTKAGIKIPVEMLDVHHVNGDRSDNELYNLEVLCVWCHAKVTRLDVV